MKNSALVFALSFILFSCSQPGETGDKANSEETTSEHKYTVTPFPQSVEFPDAAIESMTFREGTFNFEISGTSYQLGVQTTDAPQKMCANSDQGQHIHLIVDDQPYAAKYESTFPYSIDNGEHYILAFLSRSYHESIKTPKAHTAKKATVQDNTITIANNIDEPMLFYSRPKGEYIGKEQTEKVLLDFYLVNLNLGNDYKVQVEINGEDTHVVDKWQPYYIEGLPMGDNRIKLTLVDGEGNVVQTPLNPVERVFTLKEDPAPGQ